MFFKNCIYLHLLGSAATWAIVLHKNGGFAEKGGKWKGEEDASPQREEIPLDICNRIEIQLDSVH